MLSNSSFFSAFFFFSSRRRHTRWPRDWSSDVCSSDLAWTGPVGQAPPADDIVDLGGRAVLPGWVDSHSHLIFDGDRAAEFEARMAGQAYSAGGIGITTEATRSATDERLRTLVRERKIGRASCRERVED